MDGISIFFEGLGAAFSVGGIALFSIFKWFFLIILCVIGVIFLTGIILGLCEDESKKKSKK